MQISSPIKFLSELEDNNIKLWRGDFSSLFIFPFFAAIQEVVLHLNFLDLYREIDYYSGPCGTNAKEGRTIIFPWIFKRML